MLVLLYKDTNGAEHSVELTDGLEVTVGRSAGCTIRTKTNSVSRRHARISQRSEGWWLEDLGSSNHCFINGNQTEGGAIKAGDALLFGAFPIQVQKLSIDGAAEPEVGNSQAGAETATAGKEVASKRPRPQRPGTSPEEHTPDQEGADAHHDGAEPPDRAALLKARREAETNKKAAIEARRQLAASKAVDQGFQQALRDAESRAGSMENELERNRAKIATLETDLAELKTRESRLEEELDGWHERYRKIRDQLDHHVDLLEQTRTELAGREEQNEVLEAKLVQLDADNARLEHVGQEQGDALNQLKARVVQKERRVEELQRELDLMEYDLREAREELESVVDTRNADSSDQRRLEREMEMLREVNAEKEGLMAELKFTIEQKEREIYELKSGSGLQDLEEAKREVLEQYFEKNREVDSLQDEVKQHRSELALANERVAALESALAERQDVTQSPEFARKSREVERLQADIEEAQEEHRRLEQKLETFGPEARGKLEAEVNFLHRKNRALQEKLEVATRPPQPDPISATAPTTPNVTPMLTEEDVDVILDAHMRWAGRLDALQGAMTTLNETLESEQAPAEVLSEVNDILQSLDKEANRAREQLSRLKEDATDT